MERQKCTKKYAALLMLVSLNFNSGEYAFSQTDSSLLLKGVVVSGLIITRPNETPINISSLTVQKMRASGSYTISDALAKLPGISQLSTGVAIAKPVIRGLYGNRIQTVLSGLRFDNQQWQDEHGLGLNDIGIDRVEIIKGPVALLYGSEAVGGIINIIEEAPALAGTKVGEINTRLFTNTYGIYTELGLKGATEKRNWRIRAGLNSNADYADGNNNRVLNSRFGGYYLKGSLGFNKKNWTSLNNYNSSYDNFGFILSDNQNAKPVDARLSRKMDGPHHTVLLNVFSSQNTVRLKASALKINLGLQSNLRMENEGGNQVSLNMLLSTFLYNAQWIKPVSKKTQLIFGNQTIFENNTNFGSRKIIPDANMVESGISIFVKNNFDKIILESGLGITLRNIHTFTTAGVNTPEREIHPFNKTRPSINGAFGATYNPAKNFNCKFNVSTGFRSGNLAELSSNGLHEGTLRWEVGDPNLKIEQNVNTEISMAYTSSISFSAAVFYNHFNNYIFLNPTGTKYLGFDVYRYKQYDANLYGGEASIGLHFTDVKWFYYRTDFSTVTGKLSGGNYLPFIPANKFHHQADVVFAGSQKINSISFNVSVDNILAQTHPAQFETATDGYSLVNAGASAVISKGKKDITISIAGNNLLNKNYYDHLSRFKDYFIHNIGRNIAININIPFTIN